MINELNDTLKKVNNKIGIEITLPNPSKKALKRGSIFTITVGTVLLVAGVATSSKWVTLTGGISVLSGVIQGNESRKIK